MFRSLRVLCRLGKDTQRNEAGACALFTVLHFLKPRTTFPSQTMSVFDEQMVTLEGHFRKTNKYRGESKDHPQTPSPETRSAWTPYRLPPGNL